MAQRAARSGSHREWSPKNLCGVPPAFWEPPRPGTLPTACGCGSCCSSVTRGNLRRDIGECRRPRRRGLKPKVAQRQPDRVPQGVRYAEEMIARGAIGQVGIDQFQPQQINRRTLDQEPSRGADMLGTAAVVNELALNLSHI